MIATRDFSWIWQGKEIVLGLDEVGEGPLVVLLPALSSISTRREMRPLMERLAPDFRVVALDWPGFGTLPRPPITWTPDAMSVFLQHALQTIVTRLSKTDGAARIALRLVAAGHAATYALHQAAHHPGSVARIALIAPTWRGPLPTMAGGERPLFARIRRAVEAPIIGPLLYRLNVNPFVVRKMVAGHVYSEPNALSAARTAEKHEVVAAPGARFASAAFVTGGLDRVSSRDDFLALAARAALPLMLVYGAETPPRSRAEMEALAALPGVRSERLPRGKLSVHEEFPDDVYAAIKPFLAQ
ncbi:MAG TPA: alpha/beta hydrolase [Xanthobacteraceae bacterium]|nr:alpha/beta hydrolase [Xanthobacteraceae bacterium]